LPYLTPEPRGFAGRPLMALMFAVLMGFLASDVLISRMRLGRLSALAIVTAIVVIVHYVWYWAENPK
jgi:hypothetical protein